MPEDAAVIGFDDIELASYSAYSITSFVQPMDSMIDRVLDLLLSEKQPSESTNLTLFPLHLKDQGHRMTTPLFKQRSASLLRVG